MTERKACARVLCRFLRHQEWQSDINGKRVAVSEWNSVPVMVEAWLLSCKQNKNMETRTRVSDGSYVFTLNYS